MSLATDLIVAMHTAGGTKWGLANEWVTIAQSDDALRAALRAVFGKRLPTPQKLGSWLHEHLGAKTGELTLYGEHSRKRKQWVYRVAPTAPPIVVAPRPTVTVSEVPEPVPASPPPGHFTPLNKQPASAPPTISSSAPDTTAARAEAPPVGKPAGAGDPNDARPPWLRRGELKARDAAEWKRWQRRRLHNSATQRVQYRIVDPRTGVVTFEDAPEHEQPKAPVAGWADPGGSVSWNIAHEGGVDGRTRRLRLLDF
jgi:hypothetical protein